jgi:hypothetical protein
MTVSPPANDRPHGHLHADHLAARAVAGQATFAHPCVSTARVAAGSILSAKYASTGVFSSGFQDLQKAGFKPVRLVLHQ